MAKRDYYETLGVSKSASADDLKKAYRKLAMKYHPDRNPDDKDAEQKFREVGEAYEILKDADKRAAYDQFGHAAFEGGMGGGGGGPRDFDFGRGFADVFDEMFGDFMGQRGGRSGRSGQRQRNRGKDLTYNLEIALEDAYKGVQKTVSVPGSETCDRCNGSGAEPGSKPTRCNTCNGIGRVRMQQGFFTIERTCPTCGGTGTVIKDPCTKCSGAGRMPKVKTLQVNIPAGVEDGTRIRLSGEGEAGVQGGMPGDLFILLSIKPHEMFQRQGNDIYCRVPLDMATAALGGPIEVPTIDGTRARLTIPEGTQTGQQFRLRSKGMSVLRSQLRGDMYIEVFVETPQNLTKKQKELLKEFQGGDEKSRTSPQSDSFFKKVKELWEDLRG